MAKEAKKELTEKVIDDLRMPNADIINAASDSIAKKDFERRKEDAEKQLLISDYKQKVQLVELRHARSNEKENKSYLDAITDLNDQFRKAEMSTDEHRTKLRELEIAHNRATSKLNEDYYNELQKVRETNPVGYRNS